MSAPYEVFAIRYAERSARRAHNFVGGDPHDAPMPMDYFLWLVRNAERTIVIDTGFTTDMAVKRGRTLIREPKDGLALLGVDAAHAPEVVITHLHNDHVGTFGDFPRARFHLQDAEMAYVTGRHMGHELLRRPYEPDHVTGMIRMAFAGRVAFHRGDEEIAPGVSVHHVPGHTPGLQCVRVLTARGWVVLASDASHYYEHFEGNRVFPVTNHLGDVLESYRRLNALADSPRHIVPGHDPLVMQRYPAPSKALAGIAVRLDVPPRTGTGSEGD